MKAPLASLLAVLLAAASLPLSIAHARSSDRNQPMDIESGDADYSMNESRPTVLSGGVTISQGTLRINAGRADITQRNGDPVRAVLTGSPVKLSQQLDNGTPMNAAASKVDYDLRADIVVFTGNVSIQQPSGSLSGPRSLTSFRTADRSPARSSSRRSRRSTVSTARRVDRYASVSRRADSTS